MFGGSEFHDWCIQMAALTRRRTRLLLSQIGGSREENGEFLDMVVGRVPVWGFCFFCEVERGAVCC